MNVDNSFQYFIINIKTKKNSMLALKNLVKAKQFFKFTPSIIKKQSNLFLFSNSNKPTIDEQLLMLADSLKQTNMKEDYSQMANNYIQLEQNSFSRYVKQNQNDPSMMLMFLSTFEDSAQIAEYLPMLYPRIDFYEGNQLLLLMEKVLAFKPREKPKVPFPKPLEGIQSILVIMGEIYPAKSLMQWLKLIPLYTGTQYYILFMGYFSILQKITPDIKSKHQALWIKCHEKLCSVLSDESESADVRVGIITLAFQLNYGQAALLLLVGNIDFSKIDPYKTALLFINVSKYLIKKKRSSEQNDPQTQKLEKILKKSINSMVETLIPLQFIEFMKIQLLVQMWSILYDLKQVKGTFIALLSKLLKLISDKNFIKAMNSLKTSQLLVIFETMEKHKVNHQKSLKLLLVLFSPNLRTLDKSELIRLLKCLVTYVRNCQQYLINVRIILEERKFQFSDSQCLKINEILQRVEVLFPKKFKNK